MRAESLSGALRGVLLAHPPAVVGEKVLGVLQQLEEVVARVAGTERAPLPVRLRLSVRARRLLHLHLCPHARALQRGEEVHLLVGEVWVPHVEDEHDARVGAAVPRLVLEGVVEDHALALLIPHVMLGDAQLGASRAHQRQVDAQLLVGGPVVLDDVRARGECREEGVLVAAR